MIPTHCLDAGKNLTWCLKVAIRRERYLWTSCSLPLCDKQEHASELWDSSSMISICMDLLSLKSVTVRLRMIYPQLLDTPAGTQSQTQSQRHHLCSRRAGGEHVFHFSLETVWLQPVMWFEVFIWVNRKSCTSTIVPRSWITESPGGWTLVCAQ